MGAMPFSDFFKGRSGGGKEAASGLSLHVSDSEKSAIVSQLEEVGVAWFWATDAQGRTTYLSPSIVEAIGVDVERLVGQPLQSLFAPIAGEGDGRSLGLKLGTRKSFANLTVESVEQNVDLVLKIGGKPSYDPSGNFLGFRGSAQDSTDEFRMKEEAERLAQYDSLTGLANRHRMEGRIDSTLNAFRSAKRACALFMLDLDRFKSVNDTLGHAAGDQLLQQVAERLTAAISGRGEIGRLGGDEFQVLIPDMDDRGELGEIAKKIIQMLSQPYSVEEGRCTIGCSVGVAIAPYDGVERAELTRAADLALYASKNGGRGQFRFYGADLEHDANLRKRMEDDLAEAIEEGNFRLEYQPIVSLEDNRVTALEVQYAWEDDERGRVSSDTFLPVAEGSRLIVPIGEWALRTACEQAAKWPGSLRVAFKISPVQFESNLFVDTVKQVLEETELDPVRLELQLEENILQGDQTAIDNVLSALFKLGVRLTLANFGSGMTSLPYLRRAPFSTLKIGENFFEPTMNDEHGDMGLVGAIVSLAKAMDMEVGASGVHALPLLDKLHDKGVEQIQGFVFSDGLSQEDVERALEAGDWTIAPTSDGNQRASRRTVLRKIGLIHEDHYYDVTLKNLSRSGAMIQGLSNVPKDTQFVLDFGQGQLAVCSVMRSMDDTQGVEFEQALVDDGAGGLCTRNRVSPYELAAAGAPLQALPAGKYSMAPAGGEAPQTFPQFKLSENAPPQGGPRD